jgi:RimK family alpha-L-glutamate ligase
MSADITLLAYPGHKQQDHQLLRQAGENLGLSFQIWSPDDLGIHIGETGEVNILRSGEVAQPNIVLPRGVNRTWPFVKEILTHWQNQGAKIVNTPQSSDKCVDKLTTNLQLAKHKLPFIPTLAVSESPHLQLPLEVKDLLGVEGGQLVLKPAWGSGGVEISKHDTMREVQERIRGKADREASWVIDHYIINPLADGSGVDLRVFVVGGKSVSVTKRTAPEGTFITNGTGAVVEKVEDGEAGELGEQACEALGLNYGGVDLIKHQGKWHILEVNTWPGLAHTSLIAEKDLATLILKEARL